MPNSTLFVPAKERRRDSTRGRARLCCERAEGGERPQRVARARAGSSLSLAKTNRWLIELVTCGNSIFNQPPTFAQNYCRIVKARPQHRRHVWKMWVSVCAAGCLTSLRIPALSLAHKRLCSACRYKCWCSRGAQFRSQKTREHADNGDKKFPTDLYARRRNVCNNCKRN